MGKSGDKSHAVPTLRAGRVALNLAPAFGLRVLEHRFAPHGNDASLLTAAIPISESGLKGKSHFAENNPATLIAGITKQSS